MLLKLGRPKLSTERQLDKFKQAARELEANDDPAEFDRKMRSAKLRTPPKPEEKKEKPGK